MPLFPFVWQYNNQPIDVLADNVSELIVNTGKFIPLSDGLQFIDSTIRQDTLQNKLETVVIDPILGATLKGMKLDYANDKYYLGDYDGANNNSSFIVNDPTHKVSMITNRASAPGVAMFRLDGVTDSLEIQGCTATTAGAPIPNLFIKVVVGSTLYKIQLLADA
jgi:Fe-S cluster assembly iron-binding protein IscA